jgi:addiction module HigA family antidote
MELIMVRVPTHRAPTHPGEMLLEEFLIPLGLTQRELAEAIHVPYQRVNEIVNGRRGMTPSTALRLAKLFRVSADFWMNLQLRWDLYHAQKSEAGELKTIRPYPLKDTTKQVIPPDSS